MNIDSIKLRTTPVPIERLNTTEQPKELKSEDNIVFKKADLEEIVKSINGFLQPASTNLHFQLHEELGEYYVTIIDQITHEVVREIPPKKLLDVHAAMMQFMGLVIDKKI